MTGEQVELLARRFIDAWNSQDVERVVACYSAELVYRDPNTHGEVRGAEAFGHYLRKLFGAWQMNWTVREAHPLAGVEGAAVTWHASFRKHGDLKAVEADGMDLVMVEGGRICRNDVYFDRSILAGAAGGGAAHR